MDILALPAAAALMVTSALVIHNYQPPTSPTGISGLSNQLVTYISDMKDSVSAAMKEPESLVDSLAVGLGKMFMVDIRQSKEDQMNGSAAKGYVQSRQNMLERLVNPPTRTAVFAWIIFILSAQYIYESHQGDRYQKRFLLAGLLVGLNASAVAWYVSVENIFAFKTFIPASVVGALVLSSVAHRLVIAKEVEKEKKDQ